MEYKKYELNLITLAPVHIGSGEVRSSKEFIYEKGAYYFPEMGKVYLALNRKNPLLAKAFEDYLYYTPQNKRKGKRLVEFLEKNRSVIEILEALRSKKLAKRSTVIIREMDV